MSARKQAGIYVEILIKATLERVWVLTQNPELHQRWDLRFSSIQYLPKSNDSEPQRLVYETRIGAGFAIRGVGENVVTRTAKDNSATSSLKFNSDDRISLIREGAGYWRYIPTEEGVRFLTWYDYRVRFGVAGRLLDHIFRPVMGWATAWSFDRMRLWAERDITPELSQRSTLIHALCRVAISAVWFWHGLVPKLLMRDSDEQLMLTHAGLALSWLPWVGAAELGMAFLVLMTWRWRGMFAVQALLMVIALLVVALRSPAYLTHAFNPVTLNLLVVALAIIGWLASDNLPNASRCIRVGPRRLDARPEDNSL